VSDAMFSLTQEAALKHGDSRATMGSSSAGGGGGALMTCDEIRVYPIEVRFPPIPPPQLSSRAFSSLAMCFIHSTLVTAE
jgi:hypothetical protein